MKKLLFLLVLLGSTIGAASQAAAQTKTAPPIGAVEANSSDRFLMQDGAVVLVQGRRPTPLTKNVVLANGTKINYKSGIVEFVTGKKTTLQEGDYVKMNGDLVFATPASAAAARGNNSVPATAQYDPYVQQTGTATSTTVSATPMEQQLTTLLTRKIELLNQKISLMTPNPANQAALDKLNQQIKSLDAQIGR
ncbi:DUF6799 domain-containing protein [Hymenobacter norwichensis]|uniref:DUF6799 domain-containing protein n=1 Tax=Hymenobacter norwichensis TaxID=223903 RepID=UPI0003B3C35C|nr:DUF6799 domain-containing protein [Hymenobacter norwichensis]